MLADALARGPVVLYFFPKAFTSGCTIESCGFRDVSDKLAQLDTVVIGISTDTLEDQQKFTDKESLNFPLFADPDKKIAREYGVLNPSRGVAHTPVVTIFLTTATNTSAHSP